MRALGWIVALMLAVVLAAATAPGRVAVADTGPAVDAAAVLSGRVRADGGGPLQATVTVSETGQRVVTDPAGTFSLSLAQGAYTIVAAAPGFEPASRQVLFGGRIREVEIVLLRRAPPARAPFGVSSAPWRLRGEDLEASLGMMARAGAAWLRIDFVWKDIEPAPGRYTWTAYDRIVRAAGARGIGIIALLPQYHAPAWATGGGSWKTPPLAADDYGAFARELARRFRGRVARYEIGNEPNSSAFWAPAPSPVRYAALLRAAYLGIKASDPQAQVIAGGAAPWGPVYVDPLTWTRQLYDLGAGVFFDALGAHPYSAPRSPDDDSATYARLSLLRDLRAIMDAHGDAAKPIVITEIGWSTATSRSGVSPQTQAAYVARTFEKILAEYPYVPVVCVYAFRDPGTDPADHESNFGLVTAAYQPKPAFNAFQQATAAFRERRASQRP